MEKTRSPIKSLFQILSLLLSATILSVILTFIIRETMSREVLVVVLFFPAEVNASLPYILFGLLVLVLGFILVISANIHLLMIGKIGFPAREPFHIPSTLVKKGPYKYSRNPIYFGVVLILVGLGIITVSLTILISALALFLFFWRIFVRWEERKLEETFGEEYLAYKQRVRRWL